MVPGDYRRGLQGAGHTARVHGLAAGRLRLGAARGSPPVAGSGPGVHHGGGQRRGYGAAMSGDGDNRVTDRDHAQWLARLNVMNTEATYNAVVNLAEQVLAGDLGEPEAGQRLRRSAELLRGTYGLSDLDRFDFDLIDWTAIVAEEVETRRTE